jgi:hypothetical protein
VIFDVPVTVTLQYTNGHAQDVVVAVTEAHVEQRIPTAGIVRDVQINRDSARSRDSTKRRLRAPKCRIPRRLLLRLAVGSWRRLFTGTEDQEFRSVFVFSPDLLISCRTRKRQELLFSLLFRAANTDTLGVGVAVMADRSPQL